MIKESDVDNVKGLSNAEKVRLKHTARDCEKAVDDFDKILSGDNPQKGHNISGGVSGDMLRSYIERIERLEEEKAGIAADIREVFAEAKGNGFCSKTMREIVKIRKLDSNTRDEQEFLLDAYKQALGMLPLFESAENGN